MGHPQKVENISAASILCVGEDPHLLSTRAALLKALGADVEWVTETSGAMRCMAEKNFALIVLCHSITPIDAAALSIAARELDPPAQVLQIANGFDPEEKRAQINCDALIDTHPASLTDCVREILSRQTRKSPRSTPEITILAHAAEQHTR